MPVADLMSALANATAQGAGAGMRRGGGGGGDPIAKPIAVMMIFMAGLSALAHVSRQSQISVALLTGLLFGWARLDESKGEDAKWNSALSPELNYTLIELGNVLVLFFAGLSCDVTSVRIYWYPILVVGAGYSLFATLLFALLGWASGLCVGAGTVIFFGICCSLSSKQIMVDHLTRVGQSKSLHSKILQGVALFQDGIAILAMAILHAFEKTVTDASPHMGANATMPAGPFRRAGASDAQPFDPPANPWHDRYLLGDEIGKSLAMTALVGLFFVLLNVFCLRKVFAFFTVDGEMLFIGTMAYNLGASGICTLIGFSPMIGSYFAGLSLSFLPSRHQIEHKISSLRGYGMTTFYFMMGIYVHIDGKFFEKNFGWSILFTLIVVFVAPVVIWVFGWVAGLQSRTTVYTSLLSNSLGETTLTLQVLAYQAGIFDRDVFLVLVVSTLISINLCCVGTLFIEKFYQKLNPIVGPWLDRPSKEERIREAKKSREGEGSALKNHIVILGYNETGQDVAEYFREKKKEVFVVDLDPSMHAAFKFAYKGVRGHRLPRCKPIDALMSDKDKVARKNTIASAGNGAQDAPASAPAASAPAPAEALSTTTVPAAFEPPTPEKPPAPAAAEPEAPAPPAAEEPPLPGVPEPSSEAERSEEVTVAGTGFGIDSQASRYRAAMSRRLEGASASVSGQGFGADAEVEAEVEAEVAAEAEAVYADETSNQGFTIDGFLFGRGTNIFSVYADPEQQQTWERVNLKEAALVVACLVQRDSVSMCEYMKDSAVPVMCVCSTNKEAQKLYDAGCTYALQQEFVAAKELFSLLCAERASGADDNFKQRAEDHKDELEEEVNDAVNKIISKFL